MFKRTFWFTTGATAGFGGAMWIRRRVLQTVQRYTPEHVQADVTDSVRRLGTDVKAAIAEGRTAMADREVRLRAELHAGVDPVGEPPAPPGSPAVADHPVATAGGGPANPPPRADRRAVGDAVIGRRRRRRSRQTRVG